MLIKSKKPGGPQTPLFIHEDAMTPDPIFNIFFNYQSLDNCLDFFTVIFTL